MIFLKLDTNDRIGESIILDSHIKNVGCMCERKNTVHKYRFWFYAGTQACVNYLYKIASSTSDLGIPSP